MHAVPKYPVVQYDGSNPDEVLATVAGSYYGYEQDVDDAGNPVLHLINPWGNRTTVSTSAYCCNGQIFADRAALEECYHVIEETP